MERSGAARATGRFGGEGPTTRRPDDDAELQDRRLSSGRSVFVYTPSGLAFLKRLAGFVAACLMATSIGAQTQSAQTPAQAQPTPPVQPITAVKVILIGDSTIQAGSGWGASFCGTH